MKFPKDLGKRLERYEKHPLMGKLMAGVDGCIRIIMHRQYQGSNPAVASAYAPLRASVIIIFTILCITLVFGVAAPMESAAIAHGTVAVLSKRKTVQHLEGGIIKRILVEDGQRVIEGQPLIEISDVASKANRGIVQKELWIERAAELRLTALQNNNSHITFPEDMNAAAKDATELAQTMQTQAELFTTQREAQLGKLNSLKQRIAQSREEIVGLQAQIKSAESQLVYINEELGAIRPLVKEGLATKPRLLALERQAEELHGIRGQNIALIAKAKQVISGAEMDVINQINDFATRNAEELRDVRARIADSEEKLRAVTDVMERTVVLAPTEGIVTGLKFHTIGGVVAPGAPILDIVPQNDLLVLEVQIKPIDIDVVKSGLDARIIFSAYKSRRMPLFYGKVTKVSADAFTEQQGVQAVSYYTARVEVDGEQLKHLGTPMNLYPGMPADVYIRTGSRSFLGYLFEPITDSMDRAFKEE
jgi:HlyD family secretion protein